MTHDYKKALDAINYLEDKCKFHSDINPYYFETIRAALQLAQEAEQLRKERDDLAEYILEVDDSCRTLFGDEAHELAKKVVGE